jgi:hypothetical protein
MYVDHSSMNVLPNEVIRLIVSGMFNPTEQADGDDKEWACPQYILLNPLDVVQPQVTFPVTFFCLSPVCFTELW